MPKKPEPTNVLTLTIAPTLVPTAYREVTESRVLKVKLSPKELEENTQELARSVNDIQRIEEEKKSSASRYKAEIEEKQARQGRLSQLIQDGWDERGVKCHWHFECSGKDADGNLIYHPEMKALVRSDTGEVVETKSMSETDFENKELALTDKKTGDNDDGAIDEGE
ncbi:hypothetical protein [Verrucomicrobium sp. BvORR106]|uniref:hypothetical protein n=1 Tax=Verrucomicrobium sp. BvORR106 TaxID=1403819 RepID=UPI000570A69E|nr:hypothetical protein [Verrucomicrobium sp. BvORR106]